MLRKMLFSLRARLLALVLLAMVPAFAVILYSGLEQRSHAAQDATDESQQIVRLAQNDYEVLIDSAHQLLTVLAQLPQVRASDPTACNALMANLLKQYPRYSNLFAARLNGDVYCSAVPLTAPTNVADRSYFQRVLQTRDFVVGDFVIGRVSGKTAIPFAYPVLDASGQMQSVVLTAIDLTWLNQLATQANLPASSSFTIMDRNGIIFARYPDAEAWVGKSALDAPIVRMILAQRGEGTAESVGVDGVSRLYAFTPLGGGQDPSAYIYVGIPSSIAYADANSALARNLLTLGAVAMLALLAAWFGGDVFLLRRVNVLVNATQRLAAGDLSARTGVQGGVGELSQLARVFDGMADSLQQREAERKRVEAEIFRRNHELTTLYAISRATAQSLNLDETLNLAVEATLGALDVEVGGIYLVEPDGETLTLRVHRGVSDEVASNLQRVKLGEGMSGRAAAEKQPVVLDVQDYPLQQLAPYIVQERLQSLASIPLLSAGQAVGAMNLSTRRVRAFPPEELELLTAIGQQLGSAVQNARLYQKLQSELAERAR